MSTYNFIGECRPDCENLPRDITINTLTGRVNGFLVYLYDGPRVPEFDRPGVANVDKIKGKVSVFLGIPYAQAPTGNARLMVRAYGYTKFHVTLAKQSFHLTFYFPDF